jgi:protocatechuate 3,4-dioxygenase alpha subunit
LQDDSQIKEKNVPTASQTVGPFFSIGLCQRTLNNLVPAAIVPRTEIFTIRGRVLDGDGQGVPDAILEIWRADENGNYSVRERDGGANIAPRGFARIACNGIGEFELRTLKPGSIKGLAGEMHAPHLLVLIFMRGLLRHLVTRMYFPREPVNDRDPVLNLVPSERRETMIAKADDAKRTELHWDIHLQGDAETVFFEA